MPKIPLLPKSGKELYDFIMRQIEPELTSDQSPLLNEKYKNETPHQLQERGRRYIKAFDQFNRELQKYREETNGTIAQYKKSLSLDVEQLSALADSLQLSFLDNQFLAL
ncbi:MAG: hypothetical protein V1926_01575 [Candidatus Peregrinibacteria bacterium]